MAKDADVTATLVAAQATRDARKADLKAKRDTAREARSGETKADAFKRIANRRTNSVLDALGAMRGLANKANYDYSTEQTGKIVSAVRNMVDKLEADFAAGGPKRAESGFGL